MGSDQFCLRWNNFQSNIVSAFESLKVEEDFVDVTVSCEGQSIKAHKIILSACSPYFRQIFRENPCQHPVIILKDVSFSDLEALLCFMYQGEVYVSQEQLATFLKTAETLQIKGLAESSGTKNRESVQHLCQQQQQSVPSSPPVRQVPSPPSVRQVPSPPVRQVPSPLHHVPPTRPPFSTLQQYLSTPQYQAPSPAQMSPSSNSRPTSPQPKRRKAIPRRVDVSYANSGSLTSSPAPQPKSDDSESAKSPEVINLKVEPPDSEDVDDEEDIMKATVESDEPHESTDKGLVLTDKTEEDGKQDVGQLAERGSPTNTVTNVDQETTCSPPVLPSLPVGTVISRTQDISGVLSQPGPSGVAGMSMQDQILGSHPRHRWRCMQPRICTFCWKTFSNSFNLKQHIVNVHVESEGVTCHICQKVVKNKWYLRKHLVTAHGAPLKRIRTTDGKLVNLYEQNTGTTHSGDLPDNKEGLQQ